MRLRRDSGIDGRQLCDQHAMVATGRNRKNKFYRKKQPETDESLSAAS
jgi:hypothetical protein